TKASSNRASWPPPPGAPGSRPAPWPAWNTTPSPTITSSARTPRSTTSWPRDAKHSFMALSATIYKADLHVADNDRGYYASHSVTVARHPSETEERLMIRLLAYALFADSEDNLTFTKGLSEADEPDLWRKDLTGSILQWVEIGRPAGRRVLKACGKSDDVVVIAYGRNAALWWQGVKNGLQRARNLRV